MKICIVGAGATGGYLGVKLITAGLDVSSTDRSNTSGFSSSKTGFGLGTTFEQYEDIYFSPKIDLAFEDIEVDSSASTQIKKMEGNFFNTDFSYGITVDKRDQVFNYDSLSKFILPSAK